MHHLFRGKEINDRLLGIYARNNVPVVDTVPRRIQIIPTMLYNYRCVMCFQSEESHKQSQEIDFSLLEKLKDVLPFVKQVYFTGGEPLLYSAFADTMQYLSQFGCELSMSTNGSLLSGRRLEMAFRYMREVKVSLDAATPDTYAGIRRGGDFAKVVRNLTELTKLKIRHNTPLPVLNFSMVAMKSNISELPGLVRLAHTLGGETVRVGHASMHSTQEDIAGESLHFHKEESDRYMLEAAALAESLGIHLILPSLFAPQHSQSAEGAGDARPEGASAAVAPPSTQSAPALHTYDTGVCHEPWEYLLINADGSTAMCCSNCVGGGDLKTQSFDEIWNSPAAQHLRRRLNTANEPAACANCFTYKRNKGQATELPEQYKEKATA